MRSAVFVLGLVLIATVSCKKIVEDTKKNYILDIMTNGQWYIGSYLDGNNDLTTVFAGYLFKFNEDGTVISTRGTDIRNGTWDENITDYSITANFSSPDEALAKLNGTWFVKDAGEDFAVAEMPLPTGKKVLTLRKKQ